MEIDQEELLQRTYVLAKENNKLLKKLRHGAWISTVFKLLFWAVILGVPLWMYFNVLQPILSQGMDTFGQVQSMVGQAQDVAGQAEGTATEVQGILNAIPGIDLLKQLTP